MPRDRRAPGRFEELGTWTPPGFASRSIRAYLPAEHGAAPLPALYVLDGQSAFEDPEPGKPGWQLHRAVDALDRRRYVAPVVVAIHHGGDWGRREQELTPWPIEGRGGRALQFLDWVVGELVPQASKRLGLTPGAVGAAIAGASWGGLTALYAHYRHPEVFGGALALSPSCWVGDFAIFDVLARLPTPAVSRVYLDCGALEADGRMLPPARALAETLGRRGYARRQLWFRADPRGDHEDAAWRRRFPRALRFLYRR